MTRELGFNRRKSDWFLSKFIFKLLVLFLVWEDRNKEAYSYWIILPRIRSTATLKGIKIDKIYIWNQLIQFKNFACEHKALIHRLKIKHR